MSMSVRRVFAKERARARPSPREAPVMMTRQGMELRLTRVISSTGGVGVLLFDALLCLDLG